MQRGPTPIPTQATALRDLQRVGAAQAKTVMFIKPPTQQLPKVPAAPIHNPQLNMYTNQPQDDQSICDEELSCILTLAACRSAAQANGPLAPQRMVVTVPDSVVQNGLELRRWEGAQVPL